MPTATRRLSALNRSSQSLDQIIHALVHWSLCHHGCHIVNLLATLCFLFRFLFDGERVQKDQSPSQLGMADGDIIDAVVEQVGGL